MLHVEIDTSKVQKALRVAPMQLRAELADTIDHTARSFMKTLYRTRLQGSPGIRNRPSGLGRGIFSSFYKRIIGAPNYLSNTAKSGGTISGMIGSNMATMDMGLEIRTRSTAARMHEFGGTISGRMVIPLSQKASNRRLLKGGKLTYVLLGGKPYLAKVDRRAHKLEPVFIIKNSIKIRPRLGFYSTWGSMQNKTISRLNTAVQKALSKV